MKKIIVLLLCLLAVFCAVSCKNEPEKGDEPAPEPEEVGPVYVLTATSASDRFQFKWDDYEIVGGEEVYFEFQCEKTLASYTTRSIVPDEKFVDVASYSGEPDDGWYAFSYTIPEDKTARGFGVSLFVTGAVAIGDVMRIRSITIDDEEMKLSQENSWAGCQPTITVEE